MSGYHDHLLTPAERQAVLDERRRRGVPLHAPPHPSRASGIYLITAATYQHQPVMGSNTRRTAFEAGLLAALADRSVSLTAWVVLPNHYHFLVEVESLDWISEILKGLHGRTAREWNVEDGQTGKRRIWYRFVDQRIRNEEHYWKAFNYIHYNPVNHGYVQDAYDWPWSSLGSYFNDQGCEWLRAKWSQYPAGKMQLPGDVE